MPIYEWQIFWFYSKNVAFKVILEVMLNHSIVFFFLMDMTSKGQRICCWLLDFLCWIYYVDLKKIFHEISSIDPSFVVAYLAIEWDQKVHMFDEDMQFLFD